MATHPPGSTGLRVRHKRHSKICANCQKDFVSQSSIAYVCSRKCGRQLRHKANPEQRKRWAKFQHTKSTYGITENDYQQMLEVQENRCANPQCRVIFDLADNAKTPCIDRDHNCCNGSKSCGRCVRGLLCNSCNKGIGNFDDSIAKISGILDYLEIHKNLLDSGRRVC
jgi:hypothetical protein